MAVIQVQILDVILYDEYEGIVEFRTLSNTIYRAFFWGKTFKIGEITLIKLSHLSLSFDWEQCFKLNSNKEIKLVKGVKEAEYLGYGRIESVNPVIACFGDIKLDLGDWTNDERVVGEYIYWVVDRLDINFEN